MDIADVIKSKCSAVEPVLREYARIGDRRIQQMVMHPIDAGGKRIRPCLTLLACEAVGGDSQRILSAAASVELLHTFTLVHDDIMDHDLQRRGRPTVHALWGDEMGILVGDTLYSSAFRALVDVRRNGIPPKLVLDAVEVLVRANGELQEGQMMDMFFAERKSVRQEEYMIMIRKKTGSLIEACVEIGGILGGGSPNELACLHVFGANSGVAFQIRDDVLDLTGDNKRLGKPIGSDIRSGKRTLMIVHAMEHADRRERKRLLDILGMQKATNKLVREAIEILKGSGSIAYAEKRVSNLMDAARTSLEKLPKSSARQSMRAIADYLVERQT